MPLTRSLHWKAEKSERSGKSKMDIDPILKAIEEQAKILAEKLFRQYSHQAVNDVRNFLQQSNDNLNRWTEELHNHQLNHDDFRSLVRGQLDVAEMRALKQAGLAQVQIDTFTDGLLDIIVSAALSAIP